MYLMNKVRQLSDRTLYEVVDYKVAAPTQIKIHTVDKNGLGRFLTAELKDFREENGFLVSSAESADSRLFDEPEVDITIEKNLFSLLIELVQKDAFFIPASVFKVGRDYYGEEVTNFANIRVSSSSMYTGFSLLHEGNWASSRILFVDSGELQQKSFYIAISEDLSIESCSLKFAGSAKVNGKPCNFFHYNSELPIVGDVLPGLYLPLPLFNYLNLQYTRCLNALRFFSDIFEDRGIQPVATESIPTTLTKAIKVVSSLKNSSKQRRAELSHCFAHFTGSIDEFVTQYQLNLIEHYVFVLLARVQKLKTSEELFNMMKVLRIYRSLYSLALMMLRCQVFAQPDYFFPENSLHIVARGGGGGDVFTTSIEDNNY